MRIYKFERIYPEKYQKTYGFWRPVILPFSCRQRCCCPSCHQKRVLLLAYHLGDEVIAPVDHRQFVFTIPKRFRIYFRSKGDDLGMQRIIEYMARCPFSLSRVIKLTDEGKVLYRTGKSAALAFPIMGNETLADGIKRNFEMFASLDFLAEVTQHIPNRGEHQVRYYGWYSNKMRGQRKNGKFSKNPRKRK